MKYLMILAVMGLSGCSFIVGRHPDNVYANRSCYPCVEATGYFGFGFMTFYDYRKDKNRVAVGWTYP